MTWGLEDYGHHRLKVGYSQGQLVRWGDGSPLNEAVYENEVDRYIPPQKIGNMLVCQWIEGSTI